MPGPTGGGAGRYAPSPTGDLHLGNLRTAVLAWLFARSTGRRFLLRFEDLDAARVRTGVAERQRADLAALGVTFDGEPMVQSKRRVAYAAALAGLADQTYACFCSRREIAEAAVAPHGRGPRYPGTCRDLTRTQRARHRRSRTPALRLRAEPGSVTIVDLLHGEVSGQPEDVVLVRNDGTPAYHLAVVVDDAEAGVDQVVRGDDLLASAVDQAYLAGLLGHPVPTYAHVPLAVNPRGQRLAKRDGAVTLAQLGALGIGPDQVLGWIADSLTFPGPETGDSSGDQGRPTSTLWPASGRIGVSGLLATFDPNRLPKEPWVVRAEDLARTEPTDLGSGVSHEPDRHLGSNFQR